MFDHEQDAENADIELIQAGLTGGVGKDGLDIVIDKLFGSGIEAVEWD